MRPAFTILFIGISFCLYTASAAPCPGATGDETTPEDTADGVQIMARGPVHEAFAQPLNQDPTPGVVVAKKPPPPVDEIPPASKPEGERVEWIPGYWAWDDEREDYLWISGVWRATPPGRRWVPGLWAEVPNGHQWTPGFWAKDDEKQTRYLPAPKPNLDEGPNSNSPSADHFWVPGCWIYSETGYRWRPGFWNRTYADWVWIPSRYTWTARGCIYVHGYWDFPLDRRGRLFAPVYFHGPRYHAHRYTPHVVIDNRQVLRHFFVRPDYCHYYFGDYYGPTYKARGLYAWHRNPLHRRGYDPLFVFYWNHPHRAGHDHHERHSHQHDPTL